MDVLVLIDKLDDLVHNAKAVPLTDQVRIDREEIYDILDQMRATIPEEIKQARWIVKERQEMLAEAKRECDRILGEAREQAVREASQTEIVKLAERQAQDIVDDARRQARETRLEMEDWADGDPLDARGQPRQVPRARSSAAAERLHERSQETVVAGVAGGGVRRARTTTTRTRALGGHLSRRREQARLAQLRRTGPCRRTIERRILDAGRRRAGAAMNRQPWRFVVVETTRLEERVAETVYAQRQRAQRALRGRDRDRGRQLHRSTSAGRMQNMFLVAWNEGVASCPNGIA